MPRGVLVMAQAPLYGMYNTAFQPVQQMFYRACHCGNAWAGAKDLIDHEVEPPGEPSGVLGGPHQQLLAKQAVRPVLRLAGKIELRGQQTAAGRLYLYMDVAGAAGIDAGHDAAQTVTPFRLGELMTAQPETGIVILAFGVGLPEIQQGPGPWLASAGEYESNQFDRLPRHALFKQFNPLGRGWLEV